MKYARTMIEELADLYGLPLYVFDESGFTENYHKLYHAMSSLYGNYQIAYSFKTNYTPYICGTAKKLGAYAEVVSGMEYELAKRLGFDDGQIIFNGPDKGSEGIEAFRKGSMVNLDNLDELELYCKESLQNTDTEYRIGLRVNLDIGQGFDSRFGMDEIDLHTAFREVSKICNLSIAGLHCHISRCRGLDAWKRRTEYMLRLCDCFFNEPPEYIDLGSGMFGSMSPEMAEQFDEIPSYEAYAQVTAGIIAEHYKGMEGPRLFTEPGTTLINRFVECITRVEHIKSINEHLFAIMDASIHNLGETCVLKRLPVRVIPGGRMQTDYESIDLTGYTCLEQDVLLPSYRGKLAAGDYVIFENTGGYSNVLIPPFIRPDCAMVAGLSSGSYKLIKATQTYDDIFKDYLFEE